MKIGSFLILMALAAAGHAGGRDDLAWRLESKISVNFQKIPLSEALARLEAQTGIVLSYELSEDPQVSLVVRDMKLKCVLSLLLTMQNLNWIRRDGRLLVTGCTR